MVFLNATLLFGTLAVLIPVALHFLGRREPKRVTFPAIRFLTVRLETNRRRFQVKRWALLALRGGVLLAIAAALAQPQIHRAIMATWLSVGGLALLGILTLSLAGWAAYTSRGAALRWGLFAAGLAMLLLSGSWGAQTIANGPRSIATKTSPAAVALVIDNGPTSQYGSASNTNSVDGSRLESAKEIATWILGRFPQESRVALIDRSARPAAFALDASAVLRNISSTKPLQMPRPLHERIEAAVRLLRTSDLERRTLFVLTDLTESSWNVSNGEAAWTSLASEIAREPKVSVHVIDIGSEDYRNYKLDQFELADVTPPRNISTPLSVVVSPDISSQPELNAATNDQVTEGRELTVRLRLYEPSSELPIERDSQIVYPRQITVDRKSILVNASPVRVDLMLPPLDYGIHHAVVEIADSDLLPLDNSHYFTIQVEPARKILLVSDDPRARDWISSMLNPFGDDDDGREYDISYTTSMKLRDVTFSDYRVIGFIDPQLPVQLFRDELSNWVRAGGQLFVALGPSIDGPQTGDVVDWPLIGNPRRIWRAPEPGRFAQLLQSGHPALQALANVPGGAPWGAFRIYAYWQLEDADSFSQLIRYADTDHMALGERVEGAGRVMVLTTPLPDTQPYESRWNELLSSTLSGAWEVYVILLEQIFEDLSGGMKGQLTVALGQPIVLETEEDDGVKYQLFSPDQPPVQIDVADQNLVSSAPIVAGNYWLRGTGGKRLGYSANLPDNSTGLIRLDQVALDKALGAEQYYIAKGKEDIELAEGSADQARPLYPILMLFAAGLFMLEQLLANRFYTSRDSKGPSPALGAKDRAAAPSRERKSMVPA